MLSLHVDTEPVQHINAGLETIDPNSKPTEGSHGHPAAKQVSAPLAQAAGALTQPETATEAQPESIERDAGLTAGAMESQQDQVRWTPQKLL